jgi:small subunit ribosomal protein S2
MVDTNSDPSKVDFSIPSNDDASKSIAIITNYLTAAIMEGLQERAENKEAADEEQGEEATESKGRKNELDEETEGADGKKTRSAKPAAGGAGRPKQGAGRPKAASKKI